MVAIIAAGFSHCRMPGQGLPWVCLLISNTDDSTEFTVGLHNYSLNLKKFLVAGVVAQWI